MIRFLLRSFVFFFPFSQINRSVYYDWWTQVLLARISIFDSYRFYRRRCRCRINESFWPLRFSYRVPQPHSSSFVIVDEEKMSRYCCIISHFCSRPIQHTPSPTTQKVYIERMKCVVISRDVNCCCLSLKFSYVFLSIGDFPFYCLFFRTSRGTLFFCSEEKQMLSTLYLKRNFEIPFVWIGSERNPFF